jgi:formate-dependent nitrite reductase membrane component NrfD
MAVGMFALFLDLAYRAHVFRFYTAFKISSPMSWGSWILLLVFPAVLAGALIHPPDLGATALGGWLDRTRRRAAWAERPLALVNVVVGGALGIYTGILLGAFGARPLWHSAILGPLFLVSGMSAGAAVLHMLAPKARERRAMARIDVAMLGLEALFLGLLILQLATGSVLEQRAAELFLGGPYTAVFWVGVVGIGILVPIVIQTLAVSGKIRHTSWGPAMVLAGGLALRFVIVYAGQFSEWRGY